MEETKETNPFLHLKKNGEILLNAIVGSGLKLGQVGNTLRIVIDGTSCLNQSVVFVPEHGTKLFYFVIEGFGSFHAVAVREENVDSVFTGIKDRVEFAKETGDGTVELVHVVNLVLPDGTVCGKKETSTTVETKFFMYGVVDATETYNGIGIALSNKTPIAGVINDPT